MKMKITLITILLISFAFSIGCSISLGNETEAETDELHTTWRGDLPQTGDYKIVGGVPEVMLYQLPRRSGFS